MVVRGLEEAAKRSLWHLPVELVWGCLNTMTKGNDIAMVTGDCRLRLSTQAYFFHRRMNPERRKSSWTQLMLLGRTHQRKRRLFMGCV